MFHNFSCLIGKKIISSSTLSDDNQTITLKTSVSIITLTAEGDCCSESWVEHYDVIPEGCTVVKVIEKDVTTLEDCGSIDGYDDCIQQYFFDIETDKGTFTIEMRNSSNGYYGGYFEVQEIMDIDKLHDES